MLSSSTSESWCGPHTWNCRLAEGIAHSYTEYHKHKDSKWADGDEKWSGGNVNGSSWCGKQGEVPQKVSLVREIGVLLCGQNMCLACARSQVQSRNHMQSTTSRSRNATHGCLPRRIESRDSDKYLCTHDRGSILHHRGRVETTCCGLNAYVASELVFSWWYWEKSLNMPWRWSLH